MQKPAMATLLLVAALAGISPLGVNAGSYRRPVVAMGTVTVQPNQTVFGLEGDCFNIPLLDFCTNERIGFALECLSDMQPVSDCAGSLNMTATTIFNIDDSSTLAVRS